jgi:hypothetical protein
MRAASADASTPATAQAGFDWERVDRWTQQICCDQHNDIERVFLAHTARRPTIVWSPTSPSIAAPQLRFLLEYWTGLAAHGPPNRRAIDPLDMRPALGYVILVDAVDGGRDFRFRLYGSSIALISHMEMTGRLMSEQRVSGYVGEFTLASNRAVVVRRLPLYTERTPAVAERTTCWQRIVLPLVDDAGAVSRLLVGTVPVAQDGRLIV